MLGVAYIAIGALVALAVAAIKRRLTLVDALLIVGLWPLYAPLSFARDADRGREDELLAALAFGSLLLVACTPLVLLGRSIDLEYHRMILATVAMFAIAGGAALHMICRGVALEAGPGWRTAVVGLCVVFSLVGGQLAWALRPYLMRPRGPEVVFLRDVEGGLFDSVSGALRSARGIYDRDAAPLGERSP